MVESESLFEWLDRHEDTAGRVSQNPEMNFEFWARLKSWSWNSRRSERVYPVASGFILSVTEQKWCSWLSWWRLRCVQLALECSKLSQRQVCSKVFTSMYVFNCEHKSWDVVGSKSQSYFMSTVLLPGRKFQSLVSILKSFGTLYLWICLASFFHQRKASCEPCECFWINCQLTSLHDLL